MTQSTLPHTAGVRSEFLGSEASGHGQLRCVDPLVADLIDREKVRQSSKVILVASESACHPAILAALASPFTSVYAEGYAPGRLRSASLEELGRIDERLRDHDRWGNRRYYQGAELADLIESIAERRAAACFATSDWPADAVHVNVQPLSGSVANLAIYEALMEPGDRLLAMALSEGGHLTHGSPYSVAGRRYDASFYGTDRHTGRLDYEGILAQARSLRPAIVVGGYTSYPWYPDWHALRRIADAADARLVADISHTAGMVAAGLLPSPVGIADAVMFTTHKTLCGPRGAVILTTDEQLAKRIDRAVFPGLQGGPHVNKMAAIAVSMELARSGDFRRLQARILGNARTLADTLKDQGLTLMYGGTDTHLILLDLRPLGIRGSLAARVLDAAGVVCNRNVIPGDRNGADARGLRFGTTWVSQLGWDRTEMEALGGVIVEVLRKLSEHAGGEAEETLLRMAPHIATARAQIGRWMSETVPLGTLQAS